LPRVNVSIKLSSLFSQFDPMAPENTSAVVRERLRPILRAAIKHRAFVNIDMEQHSFKDVTIRIFQEVLDEPEFRAWPTPASPSRRICGHVQTTCRTYSTGQNAAARRSGCGSSRAPTGITRR